MKLKIEKPEFKKFWDSDPFTTGLNLQDWFEENVEPINKILDSGVEVMADARVGSGSWFEVVPQRKQTHTALVINIQPIKKETTEDVLRDWVAAQDDKAPKGAPSTILERAKAVLGDK